MNFADVMDEIGDRLETVGGLRVYRYPADNVQPPCAEITYPEEYLFDETYGRGSDRMTIPVTLMVGRVSDRSARDRLAALVARSGVRRFTLDNVDQLTRHIVSTDGTHASTAEVVDGNLDVTLSAGTEAGFSSLREVFLRNGLTGADFHGRVTFDPPFYGDLGGGITVLPQHGLLLRYQRDTVQRGVAVWHNIFFEVPELLVGVWQANLDGTSMTNRQATGFPSLGLDFPFTVEARLRGTVVDVRQWEVGDQPPEWDDPTLARSIDLETDAGDAEAIPTPVGTGGAGWIAAHLGTDPRSVVRYPLNDTYLELDSTPIKDVLEAAPPYTSFDSVRVQNAEFGIVTVAGVEYVAATLSLDISGPGSP